MNRSIHLTGDKSEPVVVVSNLSAEHSSGWLAVLPG
jgi:hypothetical protein